MEQKLADAAAAYAAERARMLAARARLVAALRAALDAGMSEVAAARIAGITRMTVRAWRRNG